jgi:hypothetical protein
LFGMPISIVWQTMMGWAAVSAEVRARSIGEDVSTQVIGWSAEVEPGCRRPGWIGSTSLLAVGLRPGTSPIRPAPSPINAGPRILGFA